MVTIIIAKVFYKYFYLPVTQCGIAVRGFPHYFHNYLLAFNA